MSEKKVSRHMLDRYLLGELEPEQTAEVERALEKSESLRNLLNEIKKDKESFERRFPAFQDLQHNITHQKTYSLYDKFAQFIASVLFQKKWVAGLVPAVALLAFLLFHPRLFNGNEARRSDDLAIKGGARIWILINRQGKTINPLKDKGGFILGDTVQIMISNRTPMYYAVWYEQEGTAHLREKCIPPGGSLGISGAPEGMPVAQSIILDNQYADGIFYAVACEKPIPPDSLILAIDQPGRLSSERILIEKFPVYLNRTK